MVAASRDLYSTLSSSTTICKSPSSDISKTINNPGGDKARLVGNAPINYRQRSAPGCGCTTTPLTKSQSASVLKRDERGERTPGAWNINIAGIPIYRDPFRLFAFIRGCNRSGTVRSRNLFTNFINWVIDSIWSRPHDRSTRVSLSSRGSTDDIVVISAGKVVGVQSLLILLQLYYD